MTARRTGITQALGGPELRRRRHVRVAGVLVALLVVAGWLLFVADDDDAAGFAEEAPAICEAYTERLQSELELSFPEGAPNAEAEAEYLSHAFADTLDDLVAELAALEPSGDDAAAVAALGDLTDAIRADPTIALGVDPFDAEVRPRFDDVGVEACGSGFLAASA